MRYDHLDMLPEMAFRKIGKSMTLEGGGGKKQKTPKAPDYMAIAREQNQMQRDINRETLAANRVNQITPYGNLNYTQSGTDQYGNPTYTATQVLSPEQQELYGKNTELSSGMLSGAQAGLSNYMGVMENPTVDLEGLPSTGINPGETYSDAIMRRLQPQIEQERNSFETSLVNKGIAPGTEAYMNAKRSFDQAQNDKMTSAIVGGMNTGLQANQQRFGQEAYNLTSPVNMINSLRTGNQVINPNYINPAQQANTAAPDLMGASQQGFNTAMSGANAASAAQSNFMGGLMNLGGTLGAAYMLSDKRLKKNIKRIGTHILGIGIYAYDYIWGEPSIGVMAQELEKVMPEAVITTDSGYKAVNYAML
jgi:hypothetical protein